MSFEGCRTLVEVSWVGSLPELLFAYILVAQHVGLLKLFFFFFLY